MYIASTFRRLVAHMVDEAIGAIFWVPLFVGFFHQASEGQDVVLPWILIFCCGLSRVIYEVICIYVLQALPAQYFLGLRIKSTHHPELGLGLNQVFIRVLMAQFKYLLGPSIYFMALFHRERQHLGDLLAETKVMQEQERILPLKVRSILGSVLVYVSLVVNLGEMVDLVSSDSITHEGLQMEWPVLQMKSLSAPKALGL